MNKILIIPVIFAIISMSGIWVLVDTQEKQIDELQNKVDFLDNKMDIGYLQEKLIDQSVKIEPVKEMTLKIEGGMKHGDFITINGTVLNPNSSITGVIFHNKDQVDVSVIHVFQLTSDNEGRYTYNTRINDDYLWKQKGEYTISVQNGGEYKELYFYRGLPEHLMNTEYSIEKCDKLLEMGFYASMTNLDEKHLYDMCIEIAKSLN